MNKYIGILLGLTLLPLTASADAGQVVLISQPVIEKCGSQEVDFKGWMNSTNYGKSSDLFYFTGGAKIRVATATPELKRPDSYTWSIHNIFGAGKHTAQFKLMRGDEVLAQTPITEYVVESCPEEVAVAKTDENAEEIKRLQALVQSLLQRLEALEAARQL